MGLPFRRPIAKCGPQGMSERNTLWLFDLVLLKIAGEYPALIVQSHCPLAPLPHPPPPRDRHPCRSARCSSAQTHHPPASSPAPRDHSLTPVGLVCPCPGLLLPAC